MKKFHITQDLINDLFLQNKKLLIYIVGYAIIISLLSLAVPISIQVLLNSVIYTALLQPIVLISIVLLFILGLVSTLKILQEYLVEIFSRSSFVKIASRIFTKNTMTSQSSYINNYSEGLSGKYFEIFYIQSIMATLMIEGILTLLQIIVGFIFSSFYHPYILAINLITALAIYIIWKSTKKKAITAAINRSKNKYIVYDWFKQALDHKQYLPSEQHLTSYFNRTQQIIQNYIISRVEYWKTYSLQITLLTLLYAIVVIAIFSIGSYLIISNQLSVGQLVATELIFSGAMIGIPKIANLINYYCNLIASLDKLGYLYDFEGTHNTNERIEVTSFDYTNLTIINNDHKTYINHIAFANNDKIVVLKAQNEHQADNLLQLLQYQPSIKDKSINKTEFIDNHLVFMVNLDPFYEDTLLNVLVSHQTEYDKSKLNLLINKLNLSDFIANLPNGLDTTINKQITISTSQVIKLKIMIGILLDYKFILINNLIFNFDNENLLLIEQLFHTINNTLVLVTHHDINLNNSSCKFIDGVKSC